MKAPVRKRKIPKNLAKKGAFESSELKRIAQSAHYVGSPEHKDYKSNLIKDQKPRPRANASICPKSIDELGEVNRWLEQAILRGAISDDWQSNFPRYIWYKDKSKVYVGRLTLPGTGGYKGYPIEEWEWPKKIKDFYE